MSGTLHWKGRWIMAIAFEPTAVTIVLDLVLLGFRSSPSPALVGRAPVPLPHVKRDDVRSGL